ncbi:hypothetical protein C8A03DRAFT_18919 [Achaetomium macrosporum]|uniref:Glucose-methanol-choline oxidoreductase N-terminal domain-containing protein n=1 Tax=Achaetomium macrosporum TaxID=79813 RepID=A0AAN7C2I4_9PEZI|nr:hypothetical protein C8A03DRAFT_18919 [Achaetomium macrosporum]
MAPGYLAFAAILASAVLPLACGQTQGDSVTTTDYIVVGGGPAGFVVAERLTRNPRVNVVLLEAGPDLDSDVNVNTPAKFPLNTKGAWLYRVQPDENLGGLTPDLGQGQALGGGTAIHAQIYCRGAASVFDEWAAKSGNKGLAWESILNSFGATTTWQDEAGIDYAQPINATAFGRGPLAVSRQRKLTPLDQPFVSKLAAELHLNEIDFVSGGGIGVSQGVNTIRAANRTRSYGYNAFGYLANTRPNFRLRTGAWVSAIVVANRTAVGVTYNDTATNTLRTIAAKEVIVSAGAVNSPQLLMLSGIGPAARLRELGIPVVQDLPQVGQNLVDHHLAVLQYQASPEQPTLWQYQFNATVRTEADRLYASSRGDGLLGRQWGDAYGAVRVPDSVFAGTGSTWYSRLPADRPHLVYEYISAGLLPNAGNVSAVSAWVGLVQPEGKGNITLASRDYRDAPLIRANYWGTAADRAAVLYGYKQLRSILQSAELKPLLPTELFPGPNVTTDADIWAAIQESSRSWHHPVGTLALGTVLNADWRVKGVKGLRVVGSAAAPYIPTCPIQASVYAIAHRAALDIAAADGI